MENFKTGPQRVESVVLYDQYMEEVQPNEFYLIKVITNEDEDGANKKVFYKIATYGGGLLDPYASHRVEMIKPNIKYRDVSKLTYTLFVKYLTYRNMLNYNQANRSFLNG